MSSETSRDTHPPVVEATGPSYGTVVWIASGATFLAFLDATIANLAITDLGHSFPTASVADFSWVISLYGILFAAVLVPGGRLADRVGRRTVYLWGMGLFTLMSLACALAPTLPLLLAARGLQGVGAAAMIPASLAVILLDAPPERRLASIGLWSAAASAAAAVGPTLGGILINAFDWRAIFLINVPLGVGLLWLARSLKAAGNERAPLPDLLGTLVLVLGIGGLVLGVTQASNWGWTDPLTLGSLIGGAVLLVAGILRSKAHPVPALDTQLYRSRTFSLAGLVSLLYGASMYAWLLCGVLFLVNVWDYSTLQAGLLVSPGAVLSAVAAIGVGRLAGKVSPRAAMLIGLVLITAVGAWLSINLPQERHLWDLWFPSVVFSGIGMGMVSTGVSQAAATSVLPQKFAGGIGLTMAARQVGGALGIAVLAAILTGQAAGASRPYEQILLFCTVTAALAGAAAFAIRPRPQS